MKTLISTILLCILCQNIGADQTRTFNAAANKAYKKSDFKKALDGYDQALQQDSSEPRLHMNKGSALFQLGDYTQALESYKKAQSVKNPSAKADLYYNTGNAFYKMGASQADEGKQQEAQESFKNAVQSYIKALDIKPSDKDAKWNLQLSQIKLKQMEQQQQQNQDNKNQDNKDQNKQDQKQDQNDQKQDQNKKDQKDQQNKQDQNKQDQKKQDEKKQDQKQQQQQEQDQNKQNQDQKPMPQPQKSKEELKKEEAKRIIGQFSDDADTLNKPRFMQMQQGQKPEKDW